MGLIACSSKLYTKKAESVAGHSTLNTAERVCTATVYFVDSPKVNYFACMSRKCLKYFFAHTYSPITP